MAETFGSWSTNVPVDTSNKCNPADSRASTSWISGVGNATGATVGTRTSCSFCLRVLLVGFSVFFLIGEGSLDMAFEEAAVGEAVGIGESLWGTS